MSLIIVVLYIQIETVFPGRGKDTSYMSFGKSFHNYNLRLRKLPGLCNKRMDNGQLGLIYSILLVWMNLILRGFLLLSPLPFINYF